MVSGRAGDVTEKLLQRLALVGMIAPGLVPTLISMGLAAPMVVRQMVALRRERDERRPGAAGRRS